MLPRLTRRLALGVTLAAMLVPLMPGIAQAVGLAARASVSPVIQYVGDSVGTTFSLTVKNTGRVRSIGAVQVTRPTSFWTITDCPTGPAGWSAVESSASCVYESQPGTSDDIQRGHSANFGFVATTAPAVGNRAGTWSVAISRYSDFSDPSWIKQAGPMGRGLATKAYSFELTDAVLADSPATPGDACPAANKEGAGGATGQVIVICGTNHTSSTQTPKGAYSSLGGSFITGHGGFSSGAVASGSANIVLGNWAGTTLSGAGTGYALHVRVGAFSGRYSPVVTFTGYSADNTAPVANDDPSYSTDEDTTLNASSVLANDTDANNDGLTAVQDTAPADASSFTFNPDGTFSYVPVADFNGIDSFTYHANDGSLNSNTATVTITVNSVNDAPVAYDDPSYAVDEDGTITSATSVLNNDTDVDLDTLNAVLDSGPAHDASFTLNGDGTFDYEPSADYNGTDTFTYHAKDGSADSNIATVTITINAVNDAPTAVDDSFSMTQDTTATGAAPGLLGDASDIDSISLTAFLVTGPSSAQSFTLNADGSFSYQPNTGFTGGDSFTWKANDGSLDSNVVTVSITVNASGGGGGGGGGGGCVKVC